MDWEKCQPVLVAFGNPLIDMTVVVSDEKLHKKYGLPIDGQLEVNKQQREIFHEIVANGFSIEYTAGGCSLNSCRVFSWVSGGKKPVVFVGSVGHDENATRLADIVRKSGVTTRFIEIDSLPTGSCVALVHGAWRCLCADIGAANVCHFTDIFPSMEPVMESASVIYVEGYFLTHSFRVAKKIAEFVHSLGKTFVFNLCGSYVCENHPKQVAALLPFVDILFGFVEEFKCLERFVDINALATEHPGTIVGDVALVLKGIRGDLPVISDFDKGSGHALSCGVKINETNNRVVNGIRVSTMDHLDCGGTVLKMHKPRVVIVTQGPSPLLYVADGVSVRQRTVPPMLPEEIVDTTGAGDAFVGGFLGAMCGGAGEVESWLTCGIWTAQKLLGQKGCSIPTEAATLLSG